jgi:septum formation protein
MTLWRGQQPLILASKSLARQSLLANAGISFETVAADIDERAVARNAGVTSPGEVAVLLAQVKASSVSARFPGRLIVGADQTLALGERLFNKPTNREQAAEQLHALSGHTHELHSAVAVVRNGELLFAHVAVARMTMRSLSPDAIDSYLDAAGEAVTTSVGAYQVEGFGVHLFDRIEGDHFTILGLPLSPLLQFLRSEKLLAL